MARCKLVCLALLFLVGPLLAVSDPPSAEELEQNRRKLDQWRKQPEQMQKLRRDVQALLAMPAEQRDKILQFDHDLHKESAARQARMMAVLERYGEWLERQDEETRRKINMAPDRNARLALIRDLRDKEWVAGTQPRAVREEYETLRKTANAEERAAFVAKLRQEEGQRKLEWLIAGRFWKELENKTPLPSRLSDFSLDVQHHVNDYLRPMLSREEKDRLDKAQGKWPQYPMTLVELADKHPTALPGPDGPRTFAELPGEVQKRLIKGKVPNLLREAEGRWPDFGIAVAKFCQRSKRDIILPNEFLPYSSKCLSKPVQEFVDRTLLSKLSEGETVRLFKANGRWPEYPLAIQELARDHNLRVPWQGLPGRWDNYRSGKGG